MSLPILAYHSVRPQSACGLEAFTVTPEELDTHLSHLARAGYRCLSLADLARMHSLGATPLIDRAVVITFDDALADFSTYALPVLRRHQVPATLFVPTSFVGGVSAWPGMPVHAPMLDWEDLRRIEASGVACEAHSHTHPALDMLGSAALTDELARSKAILEEGLGHPVTALAYPFGLHSRRVRRAARSAGYTVGLQVANRLARASDGPFALPRIIVPPGLDASTFERLLTTRPGAGARATLDARRGLWLAWRRLCRRTKGYDPALGSARGSADRAAAA